MPYAIKRRYSFVFGKWTKNKLLIFFNDIFRMVSYRLLKNKYKKFKGEMISNFNVCGRKNFINLLIKDMNTNQSLTCGIDVQENGFCVSLKKSLRDIKVEYNHKPIDEAEKLAKILSEGKK